MPHLRPRPRIEGQPPVDVDFIISEGERLDRVQLGPGMNHFGFAVGVDVAEDEATEAEDGTARRGVVIFLPAVSIGSVREARVQRQRTERRGGLVEETPFPPSQRQRRAGG